MFLESALCKEYEDITPVEAMSTTLLLVRTIRCCCSELPIYLSQNSTKTSACSQAVVSCMTFWIAAAMELFGVDCSLIMRRANFAFIA